MIGMKVFINGKVFTLNPYNPWAQAVATYRDLLTLTPTLFWEEKIY
ncbi:MAG: hypothetical protein PVH88_20970 [Ignavibacteria bacterium]